MIDPKLLKEAIAEAKYLEYWYGPFSEVWTFCRGEDGVHKTDDGKTIENIVVENRFSGKLMLVLTLCRECKNKDNTIDLHGTAVGMKFLDDWKQRYDKFSIALWRCRK